MLKHEVYRDQAGEYRWRSVAENGNIVATSGEGYKNRVDAEAELNRVIGKEADMPNKSKSQERREAATKPEANAPADNRVAGNDQLASGKEAVDQPGSPAHRDTPDTMPVDPKKVPKPEGKDAPAEKPASGTKYFRSQRAGLSVVLHPDTRDLDDPTMIEEVRFVPHEEMYQGDPVRVGYLATDDERAHKILADDAAVEEIDRDQYEKATTKGRRLSY